MDIENAIGLFFLLLGEYDSIQITHIQTFACDVQLEDRERERGEYQEKKEDFEEV